MPELPGGDYAQLQPATLPRQAGDVEYRTLPLDSDAGVALPREAKKSVAGREPAEAPDVPYHQYDTDGERFRKYQD